MAELRTTGLMAGDELLERLRERNPRYSESAYLFVLQALHYTIEGLGERRHITGRELAEGCRDLAIDQFGPMARLVLEYWGIHSTDDMGEIVFALVECGMLVKQESDTPDDFRDVFDFEEAFERDYPWGRLRSGG